MERITRYYTFPQMTKQVQQYIKECTICDRIKHSQHKPYEYLQEMPLPGSPWESIAFNFITKLPKSTHIVDGTEYDSIFVVNNQFTKVAYFRPFREATDVETFAFLFIDTIYSKHGIPKKIISNRDKLFTSKFWQLFTKLLGSLTKFSTAFYP